MSRNTPTRLLRPLTALALLGLTLPSAASVRQGLDLPQPARETDERERDLKRLLHLEGGGVVRGRSRWSEGHWEVRTDGGWRALAPGSVTRAVLERETLAEAKRLAQEAQKGGLTLQVALADWMLRQGLAEEALGELDSVLLADPDHAAALKLLASPPVPLRVNGVDGGAEEICRAASAASPAVRELLVRRLAEVEGPAALEERLAKLLGSHSTRLRGLAALGLRRLFPGREVKSLLMRAVLDGSDSVRLEASLALRASGEPAVILPVVRALESTNARVRANSAEALGNMGFEAAVPALITRLASLSNAPAPGGTGVGGRGYIFVGSQVAYVQDFDVEVAQGASVADPQINVLTEGSVLDVRAIGVTIETVAFESRRVRGALQRLTGANPGNSSKSWLDWWETNKGRWIPGEGPETPGH
jgi:hypothetical protein